MVIGAKCTLLGNNMYDIVGIPDDWGVILAGDCIAEAILLLLVTGFIIVTSWPSIEY